MNFDGWIFLIVAWGAIITLMVFCYGRIFSDRDDTTVNEDLIDQIRKQNQ